MVKVYQGVWLGPTCAALDPAFPPSLSQRELPTVHVLGELLGRWSESVEVIRIVAGHSSVVRSSMLEIARNPIKPGD